MARIKAEVQEAGYYTLIVDETKGVSKKEQMSLVLRYVHNGGVIERFLCYTYAQELTASALTEYILSALQIDINDCIGQCYDGATVMSGCNST